MKKKIICTVSIISILILCWCSCKHLQTEENIMTPEKQLADTGYILPIVGSKKFANRLPQKTDTWNAVKSWFSNKSATKPSQDLPADSVDIKKAFPENHDGLYVTWLGHSSLLMQIDGIRILIDPVFSNSLSPVPWLYDMKRFQSQIPITVEDLPFIDAVFLSHDHYDHLCKQTILELASKVGCFVMPLGVGEYLRDWGIDSAKIREYNWWEEDTVKGLSSDILNFVCTPARHFSGRGLFGGNESLWSSWTFLGSKHRVFYSGDSGYDLHFRQIGHHYGPFDLTIIENGQYSIHWSDIHLMPEEGSKAHLELRGKRMLPVHWGSFSLSIHSWWEPIERAKAAALKQGINLLTPRIGQTLQIDDNINTSAWWQNYLLQKED
jgi:L-ascorbate metabolism protein UlaG (beta-lactamase superfamily)